MADLLAALQQKMAYLTQRQGLISQNIANAATPKYKPKDLQSFAEVMQHAGDGAGGIQMVATNPMHFGAHGGVSAYKVVNDKDAYETKPNGNAVVLEQQMSNLSQTASDYAVATSLYHKTIGLLKTALGRGGG